MSIRSKLGPLRCVLTYTSTFREILATETTSIASWSTCKSRFS